MNQFQEYKLYELMIMIIIEIEKNERNWKKIQCKLKTRFMTHTHISLRQTVSWSKIAKTKAPTIRFYHEKWN